MAVSGAGRAEMPESIVTSAFAGLPPIAESGIKSPLTTGMTTDRKILSIAMQEVNLLFLTYFLDKRRLNIVIFTEVQYN